MMQLVKPHVFLHNQKMKIEMQTIRHIVRSHTVPMLHSGSISSWNDSSHGSKELSDSRFNRIEPLGQSYMQRWRTMISKSNH